MLTIRRNWLKKPTCISWSFSTLIEYQFDEINQVIGVRYNLVLIGKVQRGNWKIKYICCQNVSIIVWLAREIRARIVKLTYVCPCEWYESAWGKRPLCIMTLYSYTKEFFNFYFHKVNFSTSKPGGTHFLGLFSWFLRVYSESFFNDDSVFWSMVRDSIDSRFELPRALNSKFTTLGAYICFWVGDKIFLMTYLE